MDLSISSLSNMSDKATFSLKLVTIDAYLRIQSNHYGKDSATLLSPEYRNLSSPPASWVSIGTHRCVKAWTPEHKRQLSIGPYPHIHPTALSVTICSNLCAKVITAFDPCRYRFQDSFLTRYGLAFYLPVYLVSSETI